MKKLCALMLVGLMIVGSLGLVSAACLYGGAGTAGKKMPAALSSHLPIKINGNGDFVVGSNGVTRGTGSAGNPFYIENWFINAVGRDNAIFIGNTTVYFVIQNCFLENASYVSFPYRDGSGITLYAVENAMVIHSEINYNGNDGILVYSTSRYNTIKFNEIVSTTTDGIHLRSGTNNNTITGNNITSNSGSGISLSTSRYNTISGNNVTSSGVNGITLGTSSICNILSGNNVSLSTNFGITIEAGSNLNILAGNTVYSNTYSGIHLLNSILNNIRFNKDTDNSWGMYIDLSSDNVIVSNIVFSNARTGIYLLNSNGGTVLGNTLYGNTERGIMLESSGNADIRVNNVSTSGMDGIYLLNSDGGTVLGNTLYSNTERGIMLESSGNAGIKVNNVSTSGMSGIYLFKNSNDNILDGNRAIQNTEDGINLDENCNGNTIHDNHADQNTRYGVRVFFNSNNNIVTFNNISDNGDYGIWVSMTPAYNLLHHNNIINNKGGAVQGSDGSGLNFWNSSYPSGGNYWSDWTSPDINSGPNQDIPGSDGIVDFPYVLDGGATPVGKDFYPITNATGGFNKPPVAVIDTISPNPAIQGQNVAFTGHGTDPDGTVVAYNWRSDIDGALSTLSSFSTSVLSVGAHTIYFQVKDDNNTWSPEVSAPLDINPSGAQPLKVTVNANPATVVAGVDTSAITAHITNKTSGLGVSGATITSYINPKTGTLGTFTDAGGGDYTATYTPPASIGASTPVTITVNATKTGYIKGANTTVVTVIPPVTATYSVSGLVRKSGTIFPVQGVTIIVSPGGKSATTDVVGSYTISGLANGTYTISASKTGFKTNSSGLDISGSDVIRNIDLEELTGVTYTVSGHVYKTGTTTGISGAMVTVNPGSFSGLSDGTGYYQISGLPNGTFTVAASKAGYNSNSTNLVISGSSVQDKNVYLTEQAAVTYKLYGYIRESGTLLPIVGATVDVNSGLKTTTTITAGYYNITGLAPNTYTVAASKTGYVTNNTGVTITGADVQKDILLSKQGSVNQTYNVSGHVYISGTSTGIAGAGVTLNPGMKSATTDVSGAYQFTGVENGSYTVSVSKTGYISNSTAVTVSGADATKDIYLAAGTGYSVSGHVYKVGTSQGIGGAQVSLTPGGLVTSTDTTGFFKFDGIANGTYTITASKAGYLTNTATVIVSGASAIKDVYLPLGSSGSLYSVKGYVYKSGTTEGIPNATLTLNPGGKTTTTDKFGYYEFTSLGNGSYNISVLKSGYKDVTVGFKISGADVSKDIQLTQSGGDGDKLLGLDYWCFGAGAVVLLFLLILLVLLIRRRRHEGKEKSAVPPPIPPISPVLLSDVARPPASPAPLKVLPPPTPSSTKDAEPAKPDTKLGDTKKEEPKKDEPGKEKDGLKKNEPTSLETIKDGAKTEEPKTTGTTPPPPSPGGTGTPAESANAPSPPPPLPPATPPQPSPASPAPPPLSPAVPAPPPPPKTEPAKTEPVKPDSPKSETVKPKKSKQKDTAKEPAKESAPTDTKPATENPEPLPPPPPPPD